jgi:tetrachlorobenzoquinone reductase
MTGSTTILQGSSLTVRVHRIRKLAEGIKEIELRSELGEDLPAFTAGAHIDVEIPTAGAAGTHLIRQYSLAGDPADRTRYLIGVGLSAQSRGGSRYLHDALREGESLRIGTPRNLFPLNESAGLSRLVAGGIGVTPLVAMARRLSALGKPWELFLCAQTPARAAYLPELEALACGRVTTVFDGVPGGRPIDLGLVFGGAPNDTHFYCCGPSSLMAAFESSAKDLPADRVHMEWFSPKAPTQAAADHSFVVKLVKQGMEVTVPPGKSILDAILEAGGTVPHSCCDGVCGTCETPVLDGIPDHRDSVLFGAEADANNRIIVCVSRAKSASLTLDL